MADNGRHGDSGTGDPDSRRTLWRAIKRFFDRGEGDQSLRAQLEEVIDEHEEDAGDGAPTNGDLSPIERQMLRILLHFSEHDADDVAIPRGEIVAIPASASWDEVVQAFAEHGHSRMPVYGETLDEVLGMIHIKDVFPYLAAGKPELILFQCGADSLAGDPITHLRYTAEAHAFAARRLRAHADAHAGGRLLAMGGGGYNRTNLARAWTRVVEELAS